jgi:bacillithiol system protein YtxJ
MSLLPHSTTAEFRPLTNDADTDLAVSESWSRPVLIFKHSFTCGTSAEAYEELSAMPDPPAMFLVDVQASRPVSRSIADRFGIRHESPQVLVLWQGGVTWSASHYHVNGDEVRGALAAIR